MNDRRGNIFRFRRLKWGNPRRLDGLKAIGLEGTRPPAPRPEAPQPSQPVRRGMSGSGVGIVVAAVAAALAVGMGFLGWF